MPDKADDLGQIATALDTDPHALDVPRPLGVLLSARHATLLLEVCAALDRGVDEVLQEATESGLDTMYALLVHQTMQTGRG